MLPPQIKPMLGQSVMTVSIWKVFVLDGSFAKQLISLTTLPSLQVHPVWQVCWCTDRSSLGPCRYHQGRRAPPPRLRCPGSCRTTWNRPRRSNDPADRNRGRQDRHPHPRSSLPRTSRSRLYPGCARALGAPTSVGARASQARTRARLRTCRDRASTRARVAQVRVSDHPPLPASARSDDLAPPIPAAPEAVTPPAPAPPASACLRAGPAFEPLHAPITRRMGNAPELRRFDMRSPQAGGLAYTNEIAASRSLEHPRRVAASEQDHRKRSGGRWHPAACPRTGVTCAAKDPGDGRALETLRERGPAVLRDAIAALAPARR